MRRGAFIALVAALLAGGFFAVPRGAPAQQVSRQLIGVLGQIQGLSAGDFAKLVAWANSGAPAPFQTSTQPEATQANILNLGSYDRSAVFSWLQGNGRSALYAQGARDSDIGPRRPGVDYPVPSATPNAWRNLPLASATLDSDVQGGIEILGGFAAAKRDGTAAMACVSFKNTAQKIANRIVFEFPLLNPGGEVLGKLTLDRTGEFSPNIDIMSFTSLNDWQSNTVGPRGRLDSCATRKLGTAAMPILQARAAGYRIIRVEYADGTSWTPGST